MAWSSGKAQVQYQEKILQQEGTGTDPREPMVMGQSGHGTTPARS